MEQVGQAVLARGQPAGRVAHQPMLQQHSPSTKVRQAVQLKHRRRINTEEKAKVVVAISGTECIQFVDPASYFALGQFEE